MVEMITGFLMEFPAWLGTIVMAALPLTELRLAIPWAITVWEVQPLDALGLAILGNLLPFFPLYFGLRAFRNFAEKWMPWMTKVIDKSIDRAEGRVKEKYEKYGALALFLFTAIPLPMTGLYTATLAAVALKIDWRYAAPSVFFGVLTAGTIVMILTMMGVAAL